MDTMPDPSVLLPVDQDSSLRRAVAALNRHQVVVLPTDTVYGLGAHGLQAAAIDKLYQLKGRQHQKAIALLLAQAEDVATVAVNVPEIAWRLAKRFWPGALTLVLPRAAGLPDILTAGGPSIAVRVPGHAFTRRLIAMLGAPLAATSANLSGQAESVTAEEAHAVFGDRVRVYLDGGRCAGGVASTVVDLTTDPPLIRRRGPLSSEVEVLLASVK
jgi:L-threonylcarbamoyladenylate synthase